MSKAKKVEKKISKKKRRTMKTSNDSYVEKKMSKMSAYEIQIIQIIVA